MCGYIWCCFQRQRSLASIAKFTFVYILVTIGLQHYGWSQSQTLSENLKLYQQAVSQKDFAKASDHAYQISAYYRE
ncbi:MAG TPA: hypothetical protein VFZ52_22325, partial [Chryseolinea sp.]